MKIGYSTKVPSIFVTLIVLAVASAMAILVYAWRQRSALDDKLSGKVADMVVISELEDALQRQRGLVASYLIDQGNPRWLEELNRLEPIFRVDLEHIDEKVETPFEKAILNQVREAFTRYDAKREEVVALFDRGETSQAQQLYLTEVNRLYSEVAARCNEVVVANKQDIQKAFSDGRSEARRLTALVMITVGLTSLLGLGLLGFLFGGVFTPVRRLAKRAREFSERADSAAAPALQGDLEILGYYLRTLMSEVEVARTDVKKSRGELEHNRRLAAIGSTVAHVAHEIRNRLVVIGGFARSIARRPEDRLRAEDRSRGIYQEVGKLEDMLEELMDLSRPTRLQPQVHSLNCVVKDAVKMLQEHLPENVTLASDNPKVSVDAERLERVILNLVRNAAEAMGRRGVVRVSTQSGSEGARLVIEDEGPGISEEIQENIFEPFFTTKKEGSGLGLAICRQIVTSHGGTIQVESASRQGATFVVILPLC